MLFFSSFLIFNGKTKPVLIRSKIVKERTLAGFALFYNLKFTVSVKLLKKKLGEIAQLKKKLQKNKERFEIIDTEWKTAENKIVLLEKRVKPAELEVEKNKPDLKKKKSLEELVKDAEVDCGALKAQSETIKTEVDEINKKIGDIGKGKIEGIKKIIQKTKNGIKELILI